MSVEVKETDFDVRQKSVRLYNWPRNRQMEFSVKRCSILGVGRTTSYTVTP